MQQSCSRHWVRLQQEQYWSKVSGTAHHHLKHNVLGVQDASTCCARTARIAWPPHPSTVSAPAWLSPLFYRLCVARCVVLFAAALPCSYRWRANPCMPRPCFPCLPTHQYPQQGICKMSGSTAESPVWPRAQTFALDWSKAYAHQIVWQRVLISSL